MAFPWDDQPFHRMVAPCREVVEPYSEEALHPCCQMMVQMVRFEVVREDPVLVEVVVVVVG
ncbi:hypothetical protein D3C80_1954570 [compost metagenome]